MNRNKVIVIGLDGATFDIINPLLAKGILPNLAELIKSGASGNLMSTIHPTTPNAWSSFMTGKNAGKHGIYDFTQPKPGTYDVTLVNGSFRKAESLWKILSDNSRKSIVLNVPFTYPAEEINGILISGLDAPHEDNNFAYPIGIYDEIVKNVGRYDLRGTFPIGKTKKWYRIERLEEVIQNRVDVVTYLTEKYDWDFLMTVFAATDHVQHMFWNYMEEKQKGVTGGLIDRFGDIIFHTYQKVDEAIGNILRKLGEDITVIIMSDHGGGSIKSIIYLNKWLEHNGFLTFKQQDHVFNKHLIQRGLFYSFKNTRYLMKKFFSPKVKGILKALLPGVRDKIESFLYYSKIDWSKTKAYAFGMYGNININLKGREPLGIVTKEQYDELRNEIISKLKNLKDPSDNDNVVDKVFKKEELFWGDYAHKAPDLLIAWKEYKYFTRITMDDKEESVFGNLFNIDCSDFEYSGTHRLNGIFICRGNHITPDIRNSDARIIDVTPTILYLMNIPIPDGMDGRVLTKIFQKDFICKHPIVYTTTDEKTAGVGDEVHSYSGDEEREIEERLRGLGYL